MPDMKSVILTVAVATAIVVLIVGRAFAGEPGTAVQTQPQTYGAPATPAQKPAGVPTAQVEPNAPTPTTESAWSGWYGWQTLLVEAGSITLFALGAKYGSDVPMYAGLVGTYLGPPAVHWANGNLVTGAKSLGVMIGIPAGTGLLGAGIGAATERCDHSDPDSLCGLGTALFAIGGVLVGTAVAIAIDSAGFAWDEPETKSPSFTQARNSKFEIAPTFAFTQQGAGLGVVGRF